MNLLKAPLRRPKIGGGTSLDLGKIFFITIISPSENIHTGDPISIPDAYKIFVGILTRPLLLNLVLNFLGGGKYTTYMASTL
jgi:hypothetical protein